MFSRKKTVKVYDKYTGEQIGEVPEDSIEDLREKIKLAHSAIPQTSSLSFDERLEAVKKIGRLIRVHRRELVELLIREAGQPRKYAEGFEYKYSYLLTQFFDFLLEQVKPKEIDAMEGKNYLEFTPLGVVGIMSPRNAPLLLSLYSLLSSFGAGNTSVLKPSLKTPLVVSKLCELARDCLPENSLQFSVISGEKASVEFIENPLVSGLVIYSNSHVGKDNIIKYGKYLEKNKKTFLGGFIVRGRFIKYVPELAGNDPFIVLASADLEKAVEAATIGGFSNAGQMCVSAKRILVDSSISDEFKEKLIDKVSKLKVGDPKDPETDIGPVGSKRALDLAQYQLEDAVKKGGKILVGGKREDPFYYPTIVEFEAEKLLSLPLEKKPWLWIEECFAPIRSLVSFKSLDEAAALANDSLYALRCSIFGDEEEARKLASKVDAGMIVVNESPLYGDVFMPFGGYKDSGIGGAKYLIRELVNVKVVHLGAS